MGSVTDYFEQQPDDVKRFILRTMMNNPAETRGRVVSIMRDQLGDKYTEDQIDTLWYAALWICR